MRSFPWAICATRPSSLSSREIVATAEGDRGSAICQPSVCFEVLSDAGTSTAEQASAGQNRRERVQRRWKRSNVCGGARGEGPSRYRSDVGCPAFDRLFDDREAGVPPLRGRVRRDGRCHCGQHRELPVATIGKAESVRISQDGLGIRKVGVPRPVQQFSGWSRANTASEQDQLHVDVCPGKDGGIPEFDSHVPGPWAWPGTSGSGVVLGQHLDQSRSSLQESRYPRTRVARRGVRRRHSMLDCRPTLDQRVDVSGRIYWPVQVAEPVGERGGQFPSA